MEARNERRIRHKEVLCPLKKTQKGSVMVAGIVVVQVNLLAPNCPSSLN